MDSKGTASILEKYGKSITESIKSRLKEDGTYASGKTYNSIKYKTGENYLEIYFSKVLGAINEGLRPKKAFPDVQSIMKWMDKKGIRARSKKTGRFVKKEAGAFAIARSIYHKGTIKRFGYSGSKVLNFALGKNVIQELSKELTVNVSIEVSDELLKTLKNNGTTNS